MIQAASDALAVLADPSSSMVKTMRALEEYAAAHPPQRSVRVGLSSSVTVELLGLYLRKHTLLAGCGLEPVMGNYDDPVGDMDRFAQAGVEHAVLLPFFDNLVPSLEARVSTLAPEELDGIEQEVRSRYRLALEKAKGLRTVFLGTFHRMGAATDQETAETLDAAVLRFNRALREEAAAFGNVRWIDAGDVVHGIGRNAAFDARFYYRAKAPYTAAFFNEFARRVVNAARGFDGHFYKALVLDCDNTLWGGILGEDLLAGLQLGPYDYPGNIFWRMQHEFAALERQGVLLCLCSKNNPEDVEEALRSHDSMVLKPGQIVCRRVNWNDKPQNLREIAEELNIGLDSLVFVDDSAFECEAVRSQLPMVRVLQVPSVLSEYPRLAQELRELFLAGGVTAESRAKTAQYKQRAEAEQARAAFSSHDEYLASLQLKVELARNARASLPRISELTRKSNQFNLTTRRYSEAEIEQAMAGPDSEVYSLSVNDRFGSAGLTGVAVMRYEGTVAHVEAFLMSCRVIGRGVETCIWAPIFARAAQRGCTTVRAAYIASAKNAQVADFYDRLGLPLVDASDNARHYQASLEGLALPDTSWIQLHYVE